MSIEKKSTQNSYEDFEPKEAPWWRNDVVAQELATFKPPNEIERKNPYIINPKRVWLKFKLNSVHCFECGLSKQNSVNIERIISS